MVLPMRRRESREEGRSCVLFVGDAALEVKLSLLVGLLRVDMRVDGRSSWTSGGASATGATYAAGMGGTGSEWPFARSTFGLLKRLKREAVLDFFLCKGG